MSLPLLAPPPPPARCERCTPSGRRCRSNALPDSPFCRRHSPDSLAEFAAHLPSLRRPDGVVRLLARILPLLLTGEISPRKAAITGYLAQILIKAQFAVPQLRQIDPRQRPRPVYDYPTAIATRMNLHYFRKHSAVRPEFAQIADAIENAIPSLRRSSS